MELQRPFLESVIRGDKFVRITHTIVDVQDIDFRSRSISLIAEYHVHLSKSLPQNVGMSTPSGPTKKALGLTFLLPDGDVNVDSVLVNNQLVPQLSPHDELNNLSNFFLSYLAFPESSNTQAL